MRNWLSRNLVPIAIVVFASIAVIGVFEVLDGLTSSARAGDGVETTDVEGVASVAGLIKVLIFLGVGALVARPIRRGLRGEKS